MLDGLASYIAGIVDSQMFVSVHVLLIVVHVILLGVAYLVMAERKISAYIQDRIGPNRVGLDFGLPFLKFLSTTGFTKGLWGLGQPLADGVKFLLKEDYTPGRVDKALFTLAPVLIIVPALIGFAVIPWGGLWDMPPITDYAITNFFFGLPLIGGFLEQAFGHLGGETVVIAGANVNVGIIYLLAVASIGVYGVTLGGWASNSKYSFLGGLRATAQMISYEIPLGLSLLAVLLVVGSVMPQKIIEYQVDHGPMLLAQPLACILFFIAILAEANRAPFDNAEAEQELVGGYHTEYSSMRFALFFLAEYAHMVTSGAFFVLLFFGGYHLAVGIPAIDQFFAWTEPGFAETGLLGLAVVIGKALIFFSKVVLLVCFQMVIRWTIPRLRYDQIMMLGWQSLIPISLTVVVVSSIAVHLGLAPDTLVERGTLPAWLAWTPLFGINLVLLAGVVMGQGLLPRSTRNAKLPLYGSRFSPVEGEAVRTAPSNPTALEDRPIQGTTQNPVQPA
ncbi:MAG: complex I subunit 1 family protein [Planctomycetota bacterium]